MSLLLWVVVSGVVGRSTVPPGPGGLVAPPRSLSNPTIGTFLVPPVVWHLVDKIASPVSGVLSVPMSGCPRVFTCPL